MPTNQRLEAALDVLDRFPPPPGEKRKKKGKRGTWDELSEHLDAATIDAVYERMTPEMKEKFLDFTRGEIWFCDSSISEGMRDPFDAKTRQIVGTWVHEQPLPWRPLATLPRGLEQMQLGFFEMLQRIFPHLVERSVDDLIDELQPIWETVYFPALGRNVPPFWSTLEAACVARGEDPAPWRKIIDAFGA